MTTIVTDADAERLRKREQGRRHTAMKAAARAKWSDPDAAWAAAERAKWSDPAAAWGDEPDAEGEAFAQPYQPPLLVDVVRLTRAGLGLNAVAAEVGFAKSYVHRLQQEARRRGLLPSNDPEVEYRRGFSDAVRMITAHPGADLADDAVVRWARAVDAWWRKARLARGRLPRTEAPPVLDAFLDGSAR